MSHTLSVDALAIHGGTPVRTAHFPSWPPPPSSNAEAAVLDILRSGRWGANQGTVVNAFAERFANSQGAAHGVCVANGTVSLVAALKALDVGPGDEVIVPPYTFIATVTAVLLTGAVPVFADIREDTLLIDPASIRERITERTKVVIPVHLAGSVADVDAIMAICHPLGIKVIADAAQAHGAQWRGTPAGGAADLASFSFQASKNMSAGEGGAVVSNDQELIDQVWSVANVGRRRGGGWYEHPRVGWNMRMTEVQAALLDGQLDELADYTARRDAAARALTKKLADGGIGLTPVATEEGLTQHGWHLFMTTYDSAMFGGWSRDEVVGALNAEGIPALAGYPLLNTHPTIKNALAEIAPGDPAATCPVAEAVASRVLWFSQSVLLGSDDDLEQITQALGKVQAAAANGVEFHA